MHLSRRPEPRPRQPTVPTDFIVKTVGPLNKFKHARMTDKAFKSFRVAITVMDFDSGDVDPKCRQLLRLLKPSDVHAIISKAKPWVDYDGSSSFDNFLPASSMYASPSPSNQHTVADQFATILGVWADTSIDEDVHDTLLGKTSWKAHSDGASQRWLGMPSTHDYIWYPSRIFQKFDRRVENAGPPNLDPEKPHAICHVVDSTPFDQVSLRSSEVKTIILVALFNHVKPEYNHFDSFGVTVISFWDRDVRVVQGLVNFRTRDVDVRVTEVQRFDKGFRGRDGSIDPRFLTLLAYNSANVLPLPKY